jgi:AcrR family transcriptional regulator
MSATSTGRVRDKEGKQRAILDAAAQVFAECGYESSYTKDIAVRAGCSEAMIFHYFVDKQGLFEQVVARRARDAIEYSEASLADNYPATIDEYVTALFTLRIQDTERAVQWDVSARGLVDSSFAKRALAPLHQERIDVIVAGLRHYQDDGQIAVGLDVEVLAEVIGNLINMSVILGPRMFGTSHDRMAAEAETGAAVLVGGLRALSEAIETA